MGPKGVEGTNGAPGQPVRAHSFISLIVFYCCCLNILSNLELMT